MASNSNACKIFIGSIANGVTEEHIRNEAMKYGTLDTVYFMADSQSTNKGWAFVTYTNPQEAQAAIEGMNGKLQFPNTNHTVEVRLAQSKPKNFSHGHVPPSNQGSATWQTYYTPEGHPYYYNTTTHATQWERPAELDQPRPTIGGATGGATQTFGPPGANLFVFHVPNEWSDFDLTTAFLQYGTILSARIQKDPSGRNRGFGFVSYDNPQSALGAIRAMNGFNVGGKWLKVQLKKGEEHMLPNTGMNMGMGMGQGGMPPIPGAMGMNPMGGMGGMGQPAMGQPGMNHHMSGMHGHW